MSVSLFEHKKKQKNHKLTDKDRVVYAYHYLAEGNQSEAFHILGEVNQTYWTGQFHKDISRALLCHITYQTTLEESLRKESEFYLVVYRLTKEVITNKLHFNGSGNIYILKDELFRGLM